MLNPARRSAAVLAASLILSISLTATGGTIRHDRDPQLYLNLAASPQYASAGLFNIARPNDEFTGSGVLIGDRWVLTAAHLLEGAMNMKFTVGGQQVEADGWVAHPKFDGNFRKGYDLGLVRLSTPVTNVTPAVLNKSKKEQNKVGTYVGFGRTGDGVNGGQPVEQVDFLGRAGTNVIDGTVDPKGGFGRYRTKLGGGRIFVADFDSPIAPPVNVTGGPVPTDLEFLIAQGDSGGPVFIDDPKLGTVLAGIHSFGEFVDERDDSDYGDITGHTRVSLYRSWITGTMKKVELGKNVPDFVNSGGGTAMELALPSAMTVVPEPATITLLALFPLLCHRLPRPGTPGRGVGRGAERNTI